jgi:hypothetical protein
MQPDDQLVTSCVAREGSPDGRTMLDLVWALEPDDFRKLGSSDAHKSTMVHRTRPWSISSASRAACAANFDAMMVRWLSMRQWRAAAGGAGKRSLGRLSTTVGSRNRYRHSLARSPRRFDWRGKSL